MAKRKLDDYANKRDFSNSPEPKGGSRAQRGGRRFVIHEHGARSHHFDFRLEVDGVLVSWAVPKGPSTDPREKRLAVRVEDHPLDYADFEGRIPEGEYGAGPVIVWDAGTYENLRANGGDRASMAAAIEDGRVEVRFAGEKLKGGYALVHARVGGDDENWLLIKMDDDDADARRNPTHTERKSVRSGRTLDDLSG